MGLLRGAISAAFPGVPQFSGGRVILVYAIDDFLQGQVRHNQLQSRDVTSVSLPRRDRNTVDYRVLIRPLRGAVAEVFHREKFARSLPGLNLQFLQQSL
jgi:hypothetical protein